MITVYHTPKSLFSDAQFLFSAEKQVAFAEKHFSKYRKAAEVNTTDLDHAYELTNTITKAWDRNQLVKATGHSLRSTSVGDVMKLGDDYYVVASIGFEKIDAEKITVEVLAN